MVHKIAFLPAFEPQSIFLTLVYLDANGQPACFGQNAIGGWAATAPPKRAPNNISFQGIAALDNFLFARDQNGNLWYTHQLGDATWDAGGFQSIASAAGISYIDFGVCLVRGVGVVAVGLDGINCYSQLGSLGGPFSASTLVNSVEGAGASMAIAACDADPHTNQDSTATILSASNNLEINFIGGASTTDGNIWTSTQVPDTIDYPSVALITSGNSKSQAIVLENSLEKQGGVPYLLWDSSGSGTNWNSYGALPNPQGIAFISVAAGAGNGGNLQIVGIGAADGAPYLIWQDNPTGNWFPYSNPENGTMQLPTVGQRVVDVAIGRGGAGQGFLQAGYIGMDGQIYINYQDLAGNWGAYGPLP